MLGGDVTDGEFNEAVADATVAEWGGVDVWICNAGISPILAGPLDTDPAVWREILEVNLTGAFLGARAAGAGDGRGRPADLHRLGPRRTATRTPRRVQRVEGRPRRTGEGSRTRSRRVGHHGERRRSGLVRLATRRRVEEESRARRRRARGTRRNAGGEQQPTWPARTSSSPPTPPRSSPALCSTSTAGTCSYDERTRAARCRDHRRGRNARRCAVAPVRGRARYGCRAQRRECTITRSDRERTAAAARRGRVLARRRQ